MQRRHTLVLLLMLLPVWAATADSWYGIDGFLVRTPEGVEIGPDDAESESLRFTFPGETRPTVIGSLVRVEPSLSDRDAAIVAAIRTARSLGPDDDLLQSVEVVPDRNSEAAFSVGLYSTSYWRDCSAIPLNDTPGGRYSFLVLVPVHPGAAGRIDLQRLLDGLRVELAGAAG